MNNPRQRKQNQPKTPSWPHPLDKMLNLFPAHEDPIGDWIDMYKVEPDPAAGIAGNKVSLSVLRQVFGTDPVRSEIAEAVKLDRTTWRQVPRAIRDHAVPAIVANSEDFRGVGADAAEELAQIFDRAQQLQVASQQPKSGNSGNEFKQLMNMCTAATKETRDIVESTIDAAAGLSPTEEGMLHATLLRRIEEVEREGADQTAATNAQNYSKIFSLCETATRSNRATLEAIIDTWPNPVEQGMLRAALQKRIGEVAETEDAERDAAKKKAAEKAAEEELTIEELGLLDAAIGGLVQATHIPNTSRDFQRRIDKLIEMLGPGTTLYSRFVKKIAGMGTPKERKTTLLSLAQRIDDNARYQAAVNLL